MPLTNLSCTAPLYCTIALHHRPASLYCLRSEEKPAVEKPKTFFDAIILTCC
jgi:hypothetical protein